MTFQKTATAAALLLALSPLAALAETAAHDWSGSYLAVFGGTARTETLGTDITGEEYDGGTAGATQFLKIRDGYQAIAAGYNLQRGALVYGGAIEIGHAGNNEDMVVDGDDGLTADFGRYMALTARIGYAHERTLYFVKAGVARAKIRNAGGEFDGYGNEDSRGKWGYDGNEAGFGDENRSGYTLGLGFEHALSQRITLIGEYNYADFGTATYGHVDGDMTEPFSFKNELHLFKIGLSLSF